MSIYKRYASSFRKESKYPTLSADNGGKFIVEYQNTDGTWRQSKYEARNNQGYRTYKAASDAAIFRSLNCPRIRYRVVDRTTCTERFVSGWQAGTPLPSDYFEELRSNTKRSLAPKASIFSYDLEWWNDTNWESYKITYSDYNVAKGSAERLSSVGSCHPVRIVQSEILVPLIVAGFYNGETIPVSSVLHDMDYSLFRNYRIETRKNGEYSWKFDREATSFSEAITFSLINSHWSSHYRILQNGKIIIGFINAVPVPATQVV